MRIPASVSLLTFNSAEGLARCLERLKDFEEIIVSDGNSTDETRAIAERFGARVIRQYETDEPSTRCDMDKAAMRQRAMDHATLPWRIFVDSDDALSAEAVEEIRTIVTSRNPSAYVWRMPTRVFIDGKEIKHEATYPSYQTRLVHERVGATFKNPVHDRLVWDRARYPAGTMQSFYDFHWPKERVANYWGYLGAYARREIKVVDVEHLRLVPWAFRRVRTILGYLLWRLPAMYLRYGFKESMPLSIELTIVRYHIAVLMGTIGKYIATRTWFVILRETLRGKDLNRTLSNIAMRRFEAYGRVLDVGGRHDASYWRYLETRRWHKKITLDLARANPDIVADLEKDDIALPEGHCDTVLMCNVLEHLNARERVLKEVRRTLKEGGELVGVVPFLVGVHPDPHDFVRFTDEGLRELLVRAGFAHVEVLPVGRGPLAASYSQSEFLLPRIVKIFVLPVILVLDALILKLRPGWRNKFPLSYAFRAR